MGRRRKAWLWAKTGKRPGCEGFWVRWYDYAPGPDGARRRISRTRKFVTKANASKWLKQYNARADLEALNELVPVSIAEATREFLRGCQSLSMNTQIHYAGSLRFMRHIIGDDTTVSTVKPIDIENLLQRLASKRKPVTVKKHMAAVDRFFNWCIARNYADDNPAKRVTSRPRGTFVREKYIPSDAELERFIACLDTEDRRIAIWIAITAGLDRGVITRLGSDNIDFEGRCIRVTRQKTNKMIVVPLHPSLIAPLRERVSQAEQGLPLLQGLHRQNRSRDWFRLAAKNAGLPSNFVFQTLRAVAATRLIRSGARAVDVQQALGHSSLSTTLRHYYQPDEQVRQSFERLPLPGLPGNAQSNTG